MANTDRPTAVAAAIHWWGIHHAQRMPMKADIKCPPTNAQGLATGLLGMANRITAEAPMEANKVFKPPPSMLRLASHPTKKIAKVAAKAVRIFSPRLSGEEGGGLSKGLPEAETVAMA
jgi:hypothetical protein